MCSLPLLAQRFDSAALVYYLSVGAVAFAHVLCTYKTAKRL